MDYKKMWEKLKENLTSTQKDMRKEIEKSSKDLFNPEYGYDAHTSAWTKVCVFSSGEMVTTTTLKLMEELERERRK